MIKDFTDKIAVITGAACGIGRAIATSFALRGAKLALVDINEVSLRELAENLRSNGTEVLELVIDVSNRTQVAQMAKEIYDHYETIHILCNNAGVSVGGPAHLLSLKDYDWVFSVNFFGILACLYAILPKMLESEDPCHIVNTSSVAGLIPDTSGGPYTASKFATVGLTECLAQQYFNSNVKFSVLCPAFVKTDFHINSEKLGKEKSYVYSPEGENVEEFKAFKEGFGYVIENGMDPKIVSEKVIEAISKDIFYITTHPEYMALMESRIHKIREDTVALNEETIKIFEDVYKSNDLAIYENKEPKFSIKYPKMWRPIPLPLDIPIVFMATNVENSLNVLVMDMIPNIELKDVINIVTMFLNSVGSDVKILSNVKTTLYDGKKIAYEGQIEYKRNGLYSNRTLCLSTFKDNKIIVLRVGYLPHKYDENLKKILYSLEF